MMNYTSTIILLLCQHPPLTGIFELMNCGRYLKFQGLKESSMLLQGPSDPLPSSQEFQQELLGGKLGFP